MAEWGRGVGIMKRIADHLSYTRTPGNRNCLLLIKSYQVVSESHKKSRLEAVVGGLQSFRQLILLLNPKHYTVSNYLATERQTLEKAIYQKELELVNLPVVATLLVLNPRVSLTMPRRVILTTQFFQVKLLETLS
jgi:hypothetical protein